MSRGNIACIYFTSVGILIVAWVSLAEWEPDGIPICIETGSQVPTGIVSDGAGGAIAVWSDPRFDFIESDIYAQRVTGGGTTVWTENGLVLSAAPDRQVSPVATTDGQGGVICTWQDYRRDPLVLYAQRVTHLGLKWNTNGAPVCTLSGSNPANITIATDELGGALIAWTDSRNAPFDIYAQHIDIGGNALWTTDGIPVTTASGFQWVPDVVSDGAGGAIFVWLDMRNGANDVYAQRLDSSGNPVWDPDDVPLATGPHSENKSNPISDGSGGAIISWFDETETGDLHAERLDSDGNYLWGSPGVIVSDADGSQGPSQQVTWGSGGVTIVWRDQRSDSGDIYAQRLDSDGTPVWTPNGIAVCTASGLQALPYLTVADTDDVIIVWMDQRDGLSDIYAQRVNGDGVVQWDTDGVEVCTLPGNQAGTLITTDGHGGAIVIWRDGRDDLGDVYAQRIMRNGEMGAAPAPAITSVLDVPNDDGGWVNLQWERSYLDALPDTVITHYSIWRRLPESAPIKVADGGNVRRTPDDFAWEWLEDVPAHHFTSYTQTTPTQYDSTAGDPGWQHYMVSAHTSNPGVYYDSAPDSGYSVDNLSPVVPAGLAGIPEQSDELRLYWHANQELDLAGYRVYRETYAGFEPGPGNQIAATLDTTVTDTDWDVNGGYFYKVSAVDIHDNESEFAVLAPEDVTSVATSELPQATRLLQNFPNPLNPATKIQFALHEPGLVKLQVFDTAGRLVRVLVDERREVGRYETWWDGRDARGRTVSSGVYLYRLLTSDYSETRKMLLQK